MSKKPFLIWLFFLGFNCFIYATPVAPIVPGEGVWRIVSRIGECIDVLASGCEVELRQADIGSGGTFTISGVDSTMYCLAEDIEFTTGAAITIDGSTNICIDLNGHSIDGLSSGDHAFLFSGAGSSNIIIKNGEIRDCADHMITADDSLTLNELFVQKLSYIRSPEYGISFDESNLFINNAFISDCLFAQTKGLVSRNTDGALVRNCHFSHMNEGTEFQCYLDGVSVGQKSRYFCVQDCIMTGSSTIGDCDTFWITESETVVFERCKASGANYSFYFEDIDQLYMVDCESLAGAEDNAFYFEGVASGVVSNCHAIRGASAGFEVSESSNMLFKHCTATLCDGVGFYIEDAFNIIFDSCSAMQNNGNGFEFDSSTTQCKVRNCCSQSNDGFGYFNDAPLGANIFVGNSSLDNTSGAFGGAGSVAPVLLNTGAAAAAGGNRWTNVTFP